MKRGWLYLCMVTAVGAMLTAETAYAAKHGKAGKNAPAATPHDADNPAGGDADKAAEPVENAPHKVAKGIYPVWSKNIAERQVVWQPGFKFDEMP